MEHSLTVVGIGPGSPDYLPPVAARAIGAARVVVGSRRALETLAPSGARTYVLGGDLAAVVEHIRAELPQGGVVVLVSGDPGFYSFLPRLRAEFPSVLFRVIPGISSVQTAFARLAESWQDARVISLHGREPEAGCPQWSTGSKLAFLTDAFHSPRRIAGLLLEAGWPPDTRVSLCADLSYPAERVAETTLAAAAAADGFEHCVMVVRS